MGAMTDPSPLPEERPLIVSEKLAETRGRRAVRRPLHWALFSFSSFLGFAPVAAGMIFGVGSVVGAIRDPALIPWWAALAGMGLFLLCLGGLILNIYGIVEVDRAALFISAAFALLAWPGVATAVFFLTYVAPAEPVAAQLCTSVQDMPDSSHCIWN